MNKLCIKTLSAAVWVSLLSCLPAQFASAQIFTKRDSLLWVSKMDSLTVSPPDSARADSLRPKSDLEAPVDFEAHYEENLIEERITYLVGKAKVKYKTMTLEAGKITVDWNKRLLIAEPLPDSLVANGQAADGKATNGARDSLAKAERGFPRFSDGGDELTGERMEYNFATEKGRVLRGRTQLQDAKYFGAQIKRADDKTLFVSRGIYSTCDREEEPHFHFWSRKMKIVLQENVVAKPIVLFIGKIPLLALPFGFFPTRSGRHSGLIIPRYGASEREGRYLREMGYYWAINDYLDTKATADFYERSGWFFRGDFRYALRYAFTGYVGGSITHKNFELEGVKERRWDVVFNHNQQIGQTARLAASGSFANSNDFYKNFSDNRQNQLRRNVTSQATFSKTLGSSNSFSFTFRENRDLQTGGYERMLPQFGFSMGQRQLFGSREESKKTSQSSTKPEERPWYENFYLSYSSSTQNRYVKPADSLNLPVERTSSANHNLSLSLNSPKRYFGWLYLNQSMQLTEDWFDRKTDYAVKTDSAGFQITSTVNKGFAARHIFTYNASANTKIYGTFQPNLGPVRALRHVLTPSIGFSYRPDFSSPSWGYYQELTLPDGSTVRRDRFSGTSSGLQASLVTSLGNLFQMKTGPEDKPKKIDLFNLNFSTSHNFAAKQFKQSDLITSLFANPTQNLSVSLGASHSFYVFNNDSGRVLNRPLYKEQGILNGLRLINLNIGANFQLQGKGTEGEKLADTSSTNAGETFAGAAKDRFAPEQYFTDTAVSWQASFSLSYNYSKFDPRRPSKTAQLSLNNAEVRLTKNWRIGMSGQFDLREMIVVDQRYSIYRDLHCWELQFFWTPSGFNEGFYFRLGIKAPLLQDLKLERRGGRTSVLGGY